MIMTTAYRTALSATTLLFFTCGSPAEQPSQESAGIGIAATSPQAARAIPHI